MTGGTDNRWRIPNGSIVMFRGAFAAAVALCFLLGSPGADRCDQVRGPSGRDHRSRSRLHPKVPPGWAGPNERRPFPDQAHRRTGDAIEQTFTVTFVARDGRQINSHTSTVPFTLNKPRDGRNGPMVWVFEEGSLTRLQTLVSGARRISISFAQSGGGLTCGVNAAFAREDALAPLNPSPYPAPIPTWNG